MTKTTNLIGKRPRKKSAQPPGSEDPAEAQPPNDEIEVWQEVTSHTTNGERKQKTKNEASTQHDTRNGGVKERVWNASLEAGHAEVLEFERKRKPRQ
jgi:hypothetical protein